MIKRTFQIILNLTLFTQLVLCQWDFALTTKGKIIFYDKNWSEVTSAAHQFDELSAITFDEIEERIYFDDHQHNNGSIFSLKLPLDKPDSHIIEQIVMRTANERIGGMAYDPLKHNLYWTDTGNKKIFFHNVNANRYFEPKVLFDFSKEDTIPSGIAIDICRRKLYWTSANHQNPSIQRSSLSGNDREVLINTNLYFPHGIFVDQLSDRIFYVVDQQGIHFTVESAKLDGTDRQILVKDVNSSPFSLTVTESSVYWTDITRNVVWMIPKVNNSNMNPINVQNVTKDLRGIVSRVGLLPKLKSDNECKNLIKKLEDDVFPKDKDNWTTSVKKSEQNNQLMCLGNGLYSEASKACACKSGYSGSRCEVYDCDHFCVHGNCKIIDGFPKCTCYLGFEGDRCQTNKCSNYCLNDGLCEVVNNNPRCSCQDDYMGSRCETNITETCAPFCIALQKNFDDGFVPYHCYSLCKSLHPTDEAIQRRQRPDELCRGSWNKSIIVLVAGLLGGLVLIYLIIQAIRHIYKPARPRITKTFVVQKKVSQTPLTCRPIATEQCEITIENCCNLNVCETPCFDPKLLQQNMCGNGSTKEDKEILINNMENDIY